MWQLDNRTFYAAERCWMRDRDGAEVWIVVVKCTFSLGQDGVAEVATKQPPVTLAPEYFGDPATSSLKYETDFVLSKRVTDVLVHGHAYAPNRRPVSQVDVGIRAGPITKVLRVFGDRIWTAADSASLSRPREFLKMPLVYERAFGGSDPMAKDPKIPKWDPRNPVGTGYATTSSSMNGVQAPNLESPSALIRDWSDRPSPAGFGPIPVHWKPRSQYAGTYEENWLKYRMPLLPDDFDDRYFQCAPVDQQAPCFFSGGEPVVLQNLTPEGDLRFLLPRISLTFETRFYDGKRLIHEAPSLHTLLIAPDHRQFSLVFYTALRCHENPQKLKSTRIEEQSSFGLSGNEDSQAGAVS